MEYEEHEKRAWSVDFSRTDPSMLVSGSDDCKVFYNIYLKVFSSISLECVCTFFLIFLPRIYVMSFLFKNDNLAFPATWN
jgi:hypothetical protein